MDSDNRDIDQEWDVREKGFRRKLKVNNALNLFLREKIRIVDAETVHFTESLGRVLAEPVHSKIDVPPFNRSAVDGYALRAEETFSASQTNPQLFRIVDSIEIGEFKEIHLSEGCAVRVSTGAMIPKGADAVVMLEDTAKIDNKNIEVYKPLTPWKNVSRRGEDFKIGEKVLDRGEVVKPYHIAVLSATGNTNVKVFRKVVVSVISTGNELIEPEELKVDESSARIPDSNRYMLISYLKKFNTIPVDMGIVPDDPESIRKVFERALNISDIIIFSGGTSVGKKDFIPEIVNERRDGVFIHGLAIKPGMPTGMAVCDGKPVLLFPGFPVACFIAFNIVFPKILERVYGIKKELKTDCKVSAYVKRRIPSQAGIRTFTRVFLKFEDEKLYVEPIRTSGSGLLSTLLHADGIVEVEEGREGYEEGEIVEVRLI